MAVKKIIKELTYDNILQEVNEETLMKYYCKNFKKIGELFISELREDNNPTCGVFYSKYLPNKLIYNDYNDSFSGGIVNYIMYKYNITYYDALNLIVYDFNLHTIQSTAVKNEKLKKHLNISQNNTNSSFILQQNKQNTIKKKIDIRIKKSYTIEDKNYWFGKYNITINTLKHFNVLPIDYFWVNKEYRFRCNTITYSFEFPPNTNRRNIYSPLNKQQKWTSNTESEKDIFGLNQILKSNYKTDVLFIVSSLKEIMFLYELGYDAIAPQSENTKIPKKIFDLIKSKKNYKNIIIFFDFDKPGCVNSLRFYKYMKKLNIENVNYLKYCPVLINAVYHKKKDITDLYEVNHELALNLIKNYKLYL